MMNNADRAEIGAQVVENLMSLGGQDDCSLTVAGDIVTNLLHYIRLHHGVEDGDLESWIDGKLGMHDIEMNEDGDG